MSTEDHKQMSETLLRMKERLDELWDLVAGLQDKLSDLDSRCSSRHDGEEQ